MAHTKQPGHQAQLHVGSWSCLTNLISFHDKVSSLVDQRKAGDVVYQDFRKDWHNFPQHFSWRNCLLRHLSRKEKLREYLQDERQSIITNQALVPWYSVKGSLSGFPRMNETAEPTLDHRHQSLVEKHSLLLIFQAGLLLKYLERIAARFQQPEGKD